MTQGEVLQSKYNKYYINITAKGSILDRACQTYRRKEGSECFGNAQCAIIKLKQFKKPLEKKNRIHQLLVVNDPEV